MPFGQVIRTMAQVQPSQGDEYAITAKADGIVSINGELTEGKSVKAGQALFSDINTLAQRGIGAAKTSTYYALAPFIGAFLSVVILGEPIGWVFIVATLVMAAGCWLAGR